MRVAITACVAVVHFAIGFSVARASDPIALETWDAAYIAGVKAGFVHTIVRETPNNGDRILRTSTELSLTVKRAKDTVNLRMETGSDETREGIVTAVSMRQFLGRTQQLEMRGTVVNDGLHVKVDGGKRLDKTIHWSPEVFGLYRQSQIFRERAGKPGDNFSYRYFEPTVTSVVTARVAVKDFEEVLSPETGKRERLLHVEAVPDKIGNVQLPKLSLWLTEGREIVRSQFDMAPLGVVTLVRTTRQSATAPAGAATIDVGIGQSVPAKRLLTRPYDANSAVFRLTIQGDDSAASAFAQDDGQEIRNAKGNTFELHTHARRQPTVTVKSRDAGPEYLRSSFYIRSDDPRIRDYAKQAVGTEANPWTKALRIEQWVHRNMKPVAGTGTVSPADQVARTLQGDCTEFSFLTAAMCRAAGVPSRTALGLVYHVSGGRPVFSYHMWVEVFVENQWLPLEPTLGRTHIGAMHLKIADHSWHETQSLTPFLPLVRVLGKVSIEIVSVDGRS